MTNLTTLSAEDRRTMKENSKALWWTGYRPTWSGIANDLGRAAQAAERDGEMIKARYLAALREQATARSLAGY